MLGAGLGWAWVSQPTQLKKDSIDNSAVLQLLLFTDSTQQYELKNEVALAYYCAFLRNWCHCILQFVNIQAAI